MLFDVKPVREETHVQMSATGGEDHVSHPPSPQSESTVSNRGGKWHRDLQLKDLHLSTRAPHPAAPLVKSLRLSELWCLCLIIWKQ